MTTLTISMNSFTRKILTLFAKKEKNRLDITIKLFISAQNDKKISSVMKSNQIAQWKQQLIRRK